MVLSDIYPNFIVENKEIECKARLDRENYLGWLKTVAGFANGNGGTFFLGVEDKTFKLIGLDEKTIDKEKLYFYQIIKNHVNIHLNIDTEPIAYINNGKKLFILKIKIEESLEKPAIISYKGLPLIYIRRDGLTSTPTNEEMRSLYTSSKQVNYDTQLTDIKFNLSDFETFSNFYKERTNSSELNLKTLHAIGFFDDNNYLKRGSFLFSDRCKNDNTKIVCTYYRGNDKGTDNFLSSEEFSGNLIDSYNFISRFIDQRMNHGLIKKADRHIKINSYPTRALLEAIINALAHRDYFIENSQISVDMFWNRLVITSPGSMYEKGSLKPTHNLKSFLSKRRNQLICNIFILLHSMEAKGTGFEKIEEEYRDADLKHKPYIFSRQNSFSIVLPDLTYEDGIDITTEMISLSKPILNESKYDNLILAYCFEQDRTVEEIAYHIGVTNSSYLRNKIIANLVNQGFITETKKGKGKIYKDNYENVWVY